MRSSKLLLSLAFYLITEGATDARPFQQDTSTRDRGSMKVLSLRAVAPELAKTPAAEEAAAAKQEQQSKEKNFLGINLGVGFGATIDLDGGDQIDEAILDEAGIVRVKKESNEDPRILFEIHKFFEKGPGCFLVAKEDGSPLTIAEYKTRTDGDYATPRGCPEKTDDQDPVVLKGKDQRLTRWGHGPFAAIQTDKDSALSAFALGYMLGWRKGDADNSFNLGFGLILDRDITTLGDGVVANRPLPDGETTIRLKEESRLGLLVFTSFSF